MKRRTHTNAPETPAFSAKTVVPGPSAEALILPPSDIPAPITGSPSQLFPSLPTKVMVAMPPWAERKFEHDCGLIIPDIEGQMEYALEMAALNIRRRTNEEPGGPFGAAIFDVTTGRLLAAAANRVVASKCCWPHAEALAMGLLQQSPSIAHYSLRGEGMPAMRLVSTASMCIACFGVFWWGGPVELVTAATAADVERLTIFREGPVPPNWRELLTGMGITLIRENVLRSKSCRILRRYTAQGGVMYNAK